MRAVNIEIAEIKGFRVKETELKHKVNEHSTLRLIGAVNQEEEKKVMRLCTEDVQLHVNVREEGRSQILFIGNVYNMEIEHKGVDTILHLELISGTIKLDLEERIRTFQDASTQVFDLMQYVNQRERAKMRTSLSSVAIGDVVAQYMETDWEFLKRMASFTKAGLLPDVTGEGICYQVGIVDGQALQKVEISEYTIQSNISTMRAKNSRGLTLSESDICQYKVTSRDILFLGDKIKIDGNILYVYQVDAVLVGEELLFTYICRQKNNFQIPYTPNGRMIGASLEGTVKKVSGTLLEINLDVDKGNALCGNKKFPYATVYSSEGGTGWYCMPEEGDKIRLYFPSEREKDAYVISSVHLEVNNLSPESSYITNNPMLSQLPAARSNPSYKSIKNKQNKEIIFSATNIIMTNNCDMSLILDDENGIIIDSTAPVFIHSNQSLEVTSNDSILIKAENQILLEHGEKGENFINMHEGAITMQGQEFRLQEK